VQQFLKLLNCHMEHAYNVDHTGPQVTDTSNTAQTIAFSPYTAKAFFAVDAPEDDDTYGIVVGSSNAAEANTDYKLGTQISDGTAAGELDYGAHVWTDAQVVGANVDLQIQRTFINNSGGNVTVEECGIYAESSNYYFCIIRDVTGTVTIADNQTLTVDYTIRTTV